MLEPVIGFSEQMSKTISEMTWQLLKHLRFLAQSKKKNRIKSSGGLKIGTNVRNDPKYNQKMDLKP